MFFPGRKKKKEARECSDVLHRRTNIQTPDALVEETHGALTGTSEEACGANLGPRWGNAVQVSRGAWPAAG